MEQHSVPFHNREEAGRRLGDALKRLGLEAPVVLALPRGGVPVAFEVAVALEAPLDVLLVRKIGMPGQEELALGAIVEGDAPLMVVNEDVAAVARLSRGELDAAKARALAEIERRQKLYRRDAPRLETRGRSVVVVDDGVATGATVRAGLRAIRATRPKRLILAVPVAPPESIASLRAECDDLVCLETPTPFYAVGQHYADFGQTSDEEVVNLLAKAERLGQSLRGELPKG